MEPEPCEQSWVSKYCRISQYFLQFVRCTDDKCCSPFHANWLRIFPNRFLPAPVQFRQDPGGPTVPPVSPVKTTDCYADLWQCISVNNLVPLNDYEILPYDMYCPKVNSAVKQRVCNLCGIYFTSIAAVKRCKAGKGFEEAEYDDEEGSDDEEEQRNNYTEVELVDGENECPALNIFELLQNPTFVEDDDE